jgi:hypothetical protein
MALAAIGDVGPAFEEDTPTVLVLYGVQPAFQAYKIAPGRRLRLRQTCQSFGSLARSHHQFLPICGGVADAALDLDADNVKLGTRSQDRAKTSDCFLDGGYLWAACTTDGNRQFCQGIHLWSCFAELHGWADCTGKEDKFDCRNEGGAFDAGLWSS